MNKVVVPYNPNWPQMFQNEAKVINQALGKNCLAIHHIGSTAVPGLVAKPKIDIIAIVKTLFSVTNNLEKVKYDGKGELNIPFRLFFSKRVAPSAINLHVFEKENAGIELNLLFRDYLRINPKIRTEYAKLKLELVANQNNLHGKNKHRLDWYALSKDKLIKKILAQTGFKGYYIRFCSHDAEWQAYHRIRKEQIFDNEKHIIYDPQHPSITAKGHFHFVFFYGSLVIGVAHLEFLNSKEVALRPFAMDTQYQNQGLGSRFLLELEKWARYQSKKIIRAHANPKALSFYTRLGYKLMPFNDKPSPFTDTIDIGKLLH